jgi:acetylornithine deacetylase
VFTADEEIGCLGAWRLAKAKPFAVRHAIVGEPTSLQAMRAGKGYCLAEVTVRGREAHSAYPQIGASAIFRAAHLLERIERIAQQLQSDQHKDFDPPCTTINVGVIKGGSAKNVVPGECRFTLEWRTIPGQKSNFVLNAVRQEVEHLSSADPDFECEIDEVRADDSFETAADSELVQFSNGLQGNLRAPSLSALRPQA